MNQVEDNDRPNTQISIEDHNAVGNKSNAIENSNKIVTKVCVKIDEQKILLERELGDHKCLYFTCFFIIGLINNTGFVIIITASQDLAKTFNYNDQMPIITICLVIFSPLVQMMNSRWLLQINHRLKVILCSYGWTVAYLIMIISRYCHNDENPEKSHNG